jgi:hypothetical protein
MHVNVGLFEMNDDATPSSLLDPRRVQLDQTTEMLGVRIAFPKS